MPLRPERTLLSPWSRESCLFSMGQMYSDSGQNRKNSVSVFRSFIQEIIFIQMFAATVVGARWRFRNHPDQQHFSFSSFFEFHGSGQNLLRK